MRSRVATFVLALAVIASTGSLVGDAFAGNPGCCVCTGCGMENATMMGMPAEPATCLPGPGEADCIDICSSAGCLNSTFENATCSDPSLAETCGDSNVMAPASSMSGLMALILALSGFGAYYLRRRSA